MGLPIERGIVFIQNDISYQFHQYLKVEDEQLELLEIFVFPYRQLKQQGETISLQVPKVALLFQHTTTRNLRMSYRYIQSDRVEILEFPLCTLEDLHSRVTELLSFCQLSGFSVEETVKLLHLFTQRILEVGIQHCTQASVFFSLK